MVSGSTGGGGSGSLSLRDSVCVDVGISGDLDRSWGWVLCRCGALYGTVGTCGVPDRFVGRNGVFVVGFCVWGCGALWGSVSVRQREGWWSVTVNVDVNGTLCLGQ